MAKLIILCGLPGSGKSSYAEAFKDYDDAFYDDALLVKDSMLALLDKAEDSFLEEFVGVSFDDLTIYTSPTSLEYKITEIEEEGVSESITVASYKLNKSGVQVESAEAYTSNLNVIDGTKMKTVSRVSIKPAVLGFVARPINYADYQEAN